MSWNNYLFIGVIAVLGACSEPAKEQPQNLIKRTNNDNISLERVDLGLGPDRLSEYGFFKGQLSDLTPAAGVVSYELNTPLFSDYAHKARFISLPKGGLIRYNDSEVLDFPVGTTVIKNFFYVMDETKPGMGRKIMETRLLIKTESEWTALEYIWNDEQTEAFLEVAGGTIDVEWKDDNGTLKQVAYAVPNINQCKNCHSYNQELRPIGPSARQLNRDNDFGGTAANQLEFLYAQSLLDTFPANAPKLAKWNIAESGTLNDRARAYLDVNCGSCHRPEGSANTSGLFLYAHQEADYALGLNKPPVAAGKGSGGLRYDIVAGEPDNSILLYRMKSTDPGIMMPEMGRKHVHAEGVALIAEWIKSL
jgi:uncharacterized repeat protein (TIGR03806 family)